MYVPGRSDNREVTSPAEERWFVERLRAGDGEAFEILMVRYFDRLVRFVFPILGSRDAAEDIVQEVFVRVWEQRGDLDPERSIQALLFASARNRALNDLRAYRVRDRYRDAVIADSQGDHLVGSVPSGEEMILTHATFEAGMRELSPRHQLAIRLRLEEQLSYAELGEVLDISAKAAEQLVLRALTAIRRHIGGKSRP